MSAPLVVPYVDLAHQNTSLEAELLAAVARVLRHGQFILGPEVAALEDQLASWLGAPHVLGVGNGTDALVLALRLCGVGPGDEVLTVSHSFVATAAAIALVGATPVFVDIDEASMLMDPAVVERAITPRTRAVMPVHLNGLACDLDPILSICDGHGLQLLEDCAQAIGSTYRGKTVGTFGVGAFSLHPLKVLGACGDGGFVVVPDAERAERLRRMRNIGLVDRDHCSLVGGNSRLDTVQAAMLLVKLGHADAWIAARRAHARAYREALRAMPELVLPPDDWGCIYSAFVVRHPRRDSLIAHLRERGIDAKVHYPLAIHQQEAFAPWATTPLPVTERVVSQIVSLPVSPELDPSQRERVIEAVLDFG